MGDDHALVAENHTDQNRRRHIHILKRHIDQRRMAGDFGFKQTDLAVGKIFDVERRRRQENPIDFAGRDHFRIDDQVDIKILFQIVLGPGQKLHVANADGRVFDTVFLG